MQTPKTPLEQLERHADFVRVLLAPFSSASASHWVLAARAARAEGSGTASAITQASHQH